MPLRKHRSDPYPRHRGLLRHARSPAPSSRGEGAVEDPSVPPRRAEYRNSRDQNRTHGREFPPNAYRTFHYSDLTDPENGRLTSDLPELRSPCMFQKTAHPRTPRRSPPLADVPRSRLRRFRRLQTSLLGT